MAKAVGQFTIIDLNDITISATAPAVKVKDMIWLDTSTVPNQLKKWDGVKWVNIGDRNADIEIGGRNLLLKSNESKTSTAYLITTYNMSEDWEFNTTYTITIKGSVNEGQKFGIWANGSSTKVAEFFPNTSGITSYTFKTPSSIANQAIKTLRVYNYQSSGATQANIEWIKLEKGNTATDWTPAPEDVDQKIITTYYQATAPTNAKQGDLWFNTLAKKLYRRNISNWDPIEDDDIRKAIEAAQTAQTTADGKIVTYYGSETPSNPSVGDLWYKIEGEQWIIKNMNMPISSLSDVLIKDMVVKKKLYRCNAEGQWQLISDSDLEDVKNKVDQVVDEHGKLIAEKLAGVLNTAVATVKNALGYVVFDDRGIMIINQPSEAQATWAMLLSSGGLLIANARDSQGNWIWRTAITGESISADQITTGTLTAINILGVLMTGSTIISDAADSEIKLDDGVLSVKKKSSNQQFNINYKPGLPEGIKQEALEYFHEYREGNPNKLPTNTISLNSKDSYMELAFGNAPVSLGNDWVKMAMYGGTFDWEEAYPELYRQYFERYQNNPLYNPPPETAQGSKMIISLQGEPWVYFDGFSNSAGTIPPIVLYSSEIVFDVDSVVCNGNFRVRGTKNCTINTEKYGDLDYSAYETAEIYLGDIGESEVIDSECIIQLDEKLLACVNTDLPYQVFLTKYGPGDIWVEQRNKDNFIVKGDNIRFGWEVKVKRKGYENIRFGQPKTR